MSAEVDLRGVHEATYSQVRWRFASSSHHTQNRLKSKKKVTWSTIWGKHRSQVFIGILDFSTIGEAVLTSP